MEYTDHKFQRSYRADYAKDNFKYLKEHSNFLTHDEKKILKLIEQKPSWSLSTDLVWMDLKRRIIDDNYKEIRAKETKIAMIQSQIDEISLNNAIKKQDQKIKIDPDGFPTVPDDEAKIYWNYLKDRGIV